jgi:hypothetical protein
MARSVGLCRSREEYREPLALSIKLCGFLSTFAFLPWVLACEACRKSRLLLWPFHKLRNWDERRYMTFPTLASKWQSQDVKIGFVHNPTPAYFLQCQCGGLLAPISKRDKARLQGSGRGHLSALALQHTVPCPAINIIHTKCEPDWSWSHLVYSPLCSSIQWGHFSSFGKSKTFILQKS